MDRQNQKFLQKEGGDWSCQEKQNLLFFFWFALQSTSKRGECQKGNRVKLYQKYSLCWLPWHILHTYRRNTWMCPVNLTKLLAKYILLRLYYLQQCVNKKGPNLIKVCEGLQSKIHSDSKATKKRRHGVGIFSQRNSKEIEGNTVLPCRPSAEKPERCHRRLRLGSWRWYACPWLHLWGATPMQSTTSVHVDLDLCSSVSCPNPHILSAQHCKLRPCRWTPLNPRVPVCNKTDL